MLDFDFKKRKTKNEKDIWNRKRQQCFNGEQQKVIEMKGIVILVKVDEM